ncbi:efflux RND transporter periplasmic adaptor subunit [Parahaliea sp. F7430]|uniref:Efflux RND transporter periplasmic adaptor subunit n=1 Tax=Sediminihaliea albiluteola TaxID=2758564 RepID=A0A7W2TTA1_9GAMM|nr:efflux RND transporter periplasmic adaptor subunit [Sediminihaliea albiluteola]
MRFGLRKGRIVLTLLLAAVAFFSWQYCSPEKEVAPAVMQVGREDIEYLVTAIGSLEPRDYVDVGAQVSGQLTALHVDVGDEVEKGQLLAEIDADVQEARVSASRAQLKALEANLRERQAEQELARLKWQRQQRLAKDNATSDEALQSARAEMLIVNAQTEALVAQIEQHKSSLQADEATLGYSRIYAPMSGTVVSLEARRGQTLNANQQAPQLLRIADLSVMTVWTEVSEADVSRLQLGMPVYFSPLGNTTQRWHGTLRQILPTPEKVNNVILYTALFDVDNSSGELMTKMTAQVFFVLAEASNVLAIPMSALSTNEGGVTTVYVRDDEGNVEERVVQRGIDNRVKVEIKQGLAEGESILLQPSTAKARSAKNTNSMAKVR